jgi:hypothetical protein
VPNCTAFFFGTPLAVLKENHAKYNPSGRRTRPFIPDIIQCTSFPEVNQLLIPYTADTLAGK